MSTVYEDITEGQQTGRQPYARKRREGMPAAASPHDNTAENSAGAPQGGNTAEEDGKSAEEKAAAAPGEDFYQRYLDELRKERDRDRERYARDEERLKRQKLFAAIGGGLSAMHEAYSRARGVTPLTDSATSITGKWRERYDRLIDERRKSDQAYLKSALEAMVGKRNSEYQSELLRLRQKEEERRQSAVFLNEKKQEWNEKYQQGKLDIDKEKLEIDRQYKQGLISKMERDAASNELRARAAYIRAQNGGSGGAGGYTTTTTINRDDRGLETGRTTTRTPAGGSQQIGGTQSGNGKKAKKKNPMS